MQVLVKNGGKLYPLGEGKMYIKKQVKLREGLDAAIDGASGISQAREKARQLINKGASSASGDLGKMDGQNDSSTGEGTKIQIPVNASAKQLNNVQRMAKDSNNDDMEVEFTKSDASTNESIRDQKLVEMKKNSIPFTKKEMRDFLKTL